MDCVLKKKKILHIITRLILGGAQKNTVMCCAAQAQAGHEVTLAYGPIYGPEGSLLADAKSHAILTVEIPSLCRELSPWRDVACYFALRKLIRQIKPDVVHTHSSKAGILGRLAAWRERVPLVVHTIHGLPFHDHQAKWRYQLYVQAERMAAKRCHKLIGITHAMNDIFQANKIGRPEQFEVVPSGVAVEDFILPDPPRDVTRKAYQIPKDAPVIGIVARLDPLKGHGDLLDTFGSLLEQFPDLYMLFVGDGWYREELEQRVAEAGWDKRVIFAGLVLPQQVPSLLRAMDIMALPSYQEGQGRTLVEALLCGCVVVGYDVGGIGEVCIDEHTGRLVEVGNKEALSQALADLLADATVREQLAEQGLAHVREYFSSDAMFTKLEQVYDAN